MFAFLMNQARRFFRRPAPIGKRTYRRLARQSPQVLIRVRKTQADSERYASYLCYWIQRNMSFLATCYPYYSGMCCTSNIAWLAAACYVTPSRFHETTLVRCQLFSMYVNCVMAEGRIVQSVVGCVLAIASPRYPPKCGRCGGPFLIDIMEAFYVL